MSKNHDYTGGNDIYTPGETHGTAVAGIIAARDNSTGMRGVAPRATIYGYNYLVEQSDANEANAMSPQRGYHCCVQQQLGSRRLRRSSARHQYVGNRSTQWGE